MTPAPRPRGGHTLLEMVVVLALLVTVAALTLPAIHAMLTDGRVSAAGDLARARLADARGRAMEQGRPFRAGYLPGTGRFQVAPDDDPAWANADAAAPSEDVLRDALPEEVVFGTTEADLADRATAAAGSGWETAAVFEPDGSARDDATFYYGKPGLPPLGVRVRALTGAVALFDPADEDATP